MKETNFGRISLALALTLGALPAQASSPELPQPTPDTIMVTPANMNKYLFSGNTDSQKVLNQVLRAKDTVNLAIGGLTPSLSVTFTTTIANPPALLFNFASCLVPFLFPANWYHLNTASKSYMGDVTGVEIMRLNTYGIAYSVIARAKGDVELFKIAQDSVQRMQDYVKGLETQAEIGMIPEADVLQGQVELGKLSNEYINIKERISDTHATLREMLGFAPDQKFEVDAGEEAPSIYESKTATGALMMNLFNRAPERTQLEFLKEAAESGVNEARWAFLGGCTGTSTPVGPGNGGTSTFAVSTGANINVGYSWFPTVSLAKRNVKDIEIREVELSLELERKLETELGDINGEKEHLANALTAQTAAQSLLTEQNTLLDLGRITVRQRLDAITALGKANSEVLSAKIALAVHRISLKRIALEGKFLETMVANERDLEMRNINTHRSGD